MQMCVFMCIRIFILFLLRIERKKVQNGEKTLLRVCEQKKCFIKTVKN